MNIDIELARVIHGSNAFEIRNGVPGFVQGSVFLPFQPSKSWSFCGNSIERYGFSVAPHKDAEGVFLWTVRGRRDNLAVDVTAADLREAVAKAVYIIRESLT